MGERVASIVLLVEDRNQETLLRRYLQRLGQNNRNLRVRKAPHGGGSGEQFVRERYAEEVRAVRTAHTKAWLLAMIDADTGPTGDRRQQLEHALRDAREQPRGPSEAILNLIPKRNVETWVLCLNFESVDEETNYRRDPRVDAQTIAKASEALYSWTRPNSEPPASCVPSLQECLPEFGRLP
jgi:hypothetical protein